MSGRFLLILNSLIYEAIARLISSNPQATYLSHRHQRHKYLRHRPEATTLSNYTFKPLIVLGMVKSIDTIQAGN